jgi:hypothetical protein
MTAALAPQITADEARALTDAIRADLTTAVRKFEAAIDDGVPAALGYPSAWAWAEAEFGELLRQLRLPRAARLALVGSMVEDGMSVRDISDRLGVSLGTIQNDRQKLGKVVPIGPRRPASRPTSRPWGSRWQHAAELIRATGQRGMTLVELAAVMGITEGAASGLLTYVVRKGVAVRTEERRAGQRVHRIG